MWDLFASLKGQLSLPVIASGNIHERQDIREVEQSWCRRLHGRAGGSGKPMDIQELTEAPP